MKLKAPLFAPQLLSFAHEYYALMRCDLDHPTMLYNQPAGEIHGQTFFDSNRSESINKQTGKEVRSNYLHTIPRDWLKYMFNRSSMFQRKSTETVKRKIEDGSIHDIINYPEGRIIYLLGSDNRDFSNPSLLRIINNKDEFIDMIRQCLEVE